ncbi:hypothetical protein J4Q44_G00248840 [Coregonus suidteri]|uniref:Uncharacterized protein n=1 Tax=Coregonus suidteri TaxID=861788 RepID=A0AAN8L7Z1_9TELE
MENIRLGHHSNLGWRRNKRRGRSLIMDCPTETKFPSSGKNRNYTLDASSSSFNRFQHTAHDCADYLANEDTLEHKHVVMCQITTWTERIPNTTSTRTASTYKIDKMRPEHWQSEDDDRLQTYKLM